MGRDFYRILGIERNATAEEVKRGYRRMALKYHPDKNDHPQAEEQFKEVVAAFEVLSDKEKREVYDQLGEEGLRCGDGPATFDPPTSDMVPFMCAVGGTVLFAYAAFKTFQFFTRKKETVPHGDGSSSD
ncbi:hypothetical protein KR018_010629 [Drosophila ironensis]|nr:hypothetical protein KR018_010629 [Drosophila ironensis]